MSTYTIKQKYFTLAEKFTVYAEDGREAFFCENKFTTIPKRFWLTSAKGEPVYFTRRKVSFLFPKVEIFKGKGETGEPVALVKGQLSIIRARLKSESDDFGRYKITGSPFARRFKITKKENKKRVVMARFRKKIKVGDEYTLDVFEGDDAFMITLCIIIDSLYHPGH